MNISLKISDKNTEKTINLGELCKLLGINEAELQGLSLNIEKHGANLKAAVNLDDNFPGLAIDGETQDKLYYLATVELPNNEYPLAYTSRLYAGRSDTETDCPIAMVLSNICEEPAFGDAYDKALRCVYIDEYFAVGKPWVGTFSYINGCSSEHQLPIYCTKEWNVYGLEDDKFLYNFGVAGEAFEFWTVCETNDAYGAKHGIIDFNKVTEDEVQKALSNAGFKNLDMFVQETSPVVIPVNEDGSLNRNSDEYCIDYMLLASLMVDMTDDKCLVPGYRWETKEDALEFFWRIFHIT